jgi:hypothetical protein
MDTWVLPDELVELITSLAALLHARLRHRLLPLFRGLFFAQGRRTVASWLRAAQVGADFRLYYYAVAAIGHKVELLAFLLLRFLLRRLAPADHWLFALDDTPTKRYGPCVEGAGRHHNPTPGPTQQKFLYGHVWCTLAWVLHHPWWGPIGLPLLARLYVRQRDLTTIPAAYHWNFRTKLELAADLIVWLTQRLQADGKPLWLVADGFYAKRPVLKAARRQGVVLFSRLRKDAALRSLPVVVPASKRGPGQPRKYGTQALSLAKRAGQSRGWQTVEVEQYRQRVTKTYKTFLATWRPAGGVIRVVLVREDHGWLAFFCTDPNVSAATILEVMADRGTLEQDFHDLKEVEGLGQQQVRHLWASVGAYHLCLWAHTLVEWWAWDRPHEEICDRSASPWDDPARRPSHADRRKALQRWSLQQEYLQCGGDEVLPPRMRQLVQRLLRQAA